MVGLAITILWLALGVVVLGAIVYVALWAIRQFVPIPPRVETAVWAVFVILVLIYVLTAINGGGVPVPHLGKLSLPVLSTKQERQAGLTDGAASRYIGVLLT